MAILAVTLCGTTCGNAQMPRIETFTIDDGLPSSVIFNLAQDRTGRLWILNRVGVTLYDGREFRTYTTAEGLPSGLGALTLDDTDRAWAATLWEVPRIFKLDGDRWIELSKPSKERAAAHSNLALAVLMDGEETLVAASGFESGLWLWDGSGSDPPRRARGVLPSEGITGLVTFGERIAVGTYAGLCFVDVDAALDCSLTEREPRLGRPIRGLHAPREPGRPPRLWLLIQESGPFGRGELSLAFLEDGRLTVVTPREMFSRLPGEKPRFLTPDAAGGVYLGSPYCAYYLDPDSSSLTPIGMREGLVAEGATAFLLDRESNVWVGSQRGLSRIGTRRFLSLDRSQGLQDDEVSAVLEVAPGKFLLGHVDGLTFLEGDQMETLALSPLLGGRPGDHRILQMVQGGDGSVWMPTSGPGLLRLGPDRSLTSYLADERVTAMTLDEGGRLWAAGPTGLYLWTGESFSPRYERYSSGVVRRMVSAGGRFFLATRGGLLVIDEGRLRWAHASNPAADSLYTVHVAASGEVWVGSGTGLYELREGELVKVRSPTIDNPIYFMLRDDDGRMWLGTDNGALVWDGAKLRRLTRDHGLIGRETNRGAALVDHRGRIWIGTDRGVSIYEKRYDHALPAPRIELVDMKAGGLSYPPDSTLKLGHREHHLTFSFQTIAFSREEELQVRYRLEGFDKVPHGPERLLSSEVSYSYLPPGTYRFHVAAGWAGGAWSGEVSSAAILIQRPFWQTLWFYALLLVTVGTGGFGYFSLRVRSIRRRAGELEEVNLRLSEAALERERLIQDLEMKNAELERFTYTVSHDLKSPLVTIRGFLGYLKEDHQAGNLERMVSDIERIESASAKMGQLLAELLELSRIGRVVNPSEEIPLGELAREAVELAEAILRQSGATVRIAEGLPSVFGDRPRLLEVMQNLLENAIKFSGPEPKPRIEIGVRRDGVGEGSEGELVAYVRDNGIGFDPRYREQVFGLFDRLDHEREGTGVGLALVRRIVEFHGGRVWAESEGAGKGSTFCFVLPWSKG